MRQTPPRKPRSGWPAPDRALVAHMEAAGLMRAPGQAVVNSAPADGSWARFDEVAAGVVPDDLADALGPARAVWDAYPRSVRRGLLETLVQAKRPETRARRIAEIAHAVARGERPGVFAKRGRVP